MRRDILLLVLSALSLVVEWTCIIIPNKTEFKPCACGDPFHVGDGTIEYMIYLDGLDDHVTRDEVDEMKTFIREHSIKIRFNLIERY